MTVTAHDEPGTIANEAERALRAGRVELARELANEALAIQPNDGRVALVAALATARARMLADSEDPEQPPVPDRVAVAYRLGVDPGVRVEEAREIVLGLMARGRSRGRLPRRFGGGTLPNGTRGVIHCARPDVCVLVRDRRAVALRISRSGRPT
jgi:hypothetical protein